MGNEEKRDEKRKRLGLVIGIFLAPVWTIIRMNRETDVLFLCSCRMKKKKMEEQFQKIIITRGVISIWVTATSYAVVVRRAPSSPAHRRRSPHSLLISNYYLSCCDDAAE